MSFSRAFQWYHSHLDPIWPDGTFKARVSACTFFKCPNLSHSLKLSAQSTQKKNSGWWDNNKLGQANVTVFAEGVINTKPEKILKRIQSDISEKCVQKLRAFFCIVFVPNKKNTPDSWFDTNRRKQIFIDDICNTVRCAFLFKPKVSLLYCNFVSSVAFLFFLLALHFFAFLPS